MIPEMTHPLGIHWSQPKREDIELDDTHALMDAEAFARLKNYSTTIPSGVYPGKMWKAQIEPGLWHLRWFGEVPGMPNMCSNNHRIILVVLP